MTFSLKNNSRMSPDDPFEYGRRRPIVAMLLSIIPGLGHQYSGYLFIGILFFLIFLAVSWLSAVLFAVVETRLLSVAILCAPFMLAFYIIIDAMLCAKRQPVEYRLKWYNKEWAYFAIFGLVACIANPIMDMFVGKNVVRAYFVSTKSMMPTILNHDLVLINKLIEPVRNSVVLVAFDKESNSNESRLEAGYALRRVIAVPGDKIEMRGAKVFINSNLLPEPYVRLEDIRTHNQLIMESYRWPLDTVPMGKYFLLSDSREYGLDSRVVGYMSREDIVGVACKILWSWNFSKNDIKWERLARVIE